MGIANEPDALRFMIPAFLFALTLVVFFHELGHFLVARWCRVRVETFSIGFGSEIFGFTDKHGTRWRFAWIPLGGYVKFMGDEDPASTPDRGKLGRMSDEERSGSFQFKPLWQRAAIVAAGPIASFLLGIGLITLVMMVYGQQLTPPRIGMVAPGSPAAEAGLRSGDTVLAVDGAQIQAFEDLRDVAKDNPGEALRLTIRRGDETFDVSATPRAGESASAASLPTAGSPLGVAAYIPAKVKSVFPGSPAEKSGLAPGDRVISVNGEAVESFYDLQRIVSQNPGNALTLVVERGAGERVTLQATPEAAPKPGPDGKTLGVLGFRADADLGDQELLRYYGPIEGLRIGIEQTIFIVDQTITYIGKVITGRESADQLSGPFGIAYMAGQVAALGFRFLLQLTALLSISIGLFNLFPIPLLDGGHLLYYAIEGLRGRPLSERAQRAGFRIGIVIVLMLLAVASYNDIVRLGTVFGDWIDRLQNL